MPHRLFSRQMDPRSPWHHCRDREYQDQRGKGPSRTQPVHVLDQLVLDKRQFGGSTYRSLVSAVIRSAPDRSVEVAPAHPTTGCRWHRTEVLKRPAAVCRSPIRPPGTKLKRRLADPSHDRPILAPTVMETLIPPGLIVAARVEVDPLQALGRACWTAAEQLTANLVSLDAVWERGRVSSVRRSLTGEKQYHQPTRGSWSGL